MNEVLRDLHIPGDCICAERHRHLARFDIRLERKPFVLRLLERNAKEIALHMRMMTVPIIKLIPSEGIVRLQVAMDKAEPTSINDLLRGEPIPPNASFPVLLGEDDSGEKLWMDFSDNPHLLVAGNTGSGKSTLLHTIIAGALFLNAKRYRSAQIFLSDPKRVEFGEYNHASLSDVIKRVSNTYEETIHDLRKIHAIMESRYNVMSSINMKSIEEDPHKFRYILCIIDEVADLTIQDKKRGSLQELLVQIAQKGRAAGIYLTLATQRPSVDVITGIIKANFPGRIACRTVSRKDSEVILDRPGAETLLGRGDAVLQNMKYDSVRFQVGYTTPKNTIKLIEFIKKHTLRVA